MRRKKNIRTSKCDFSSLNRKVKGLGIMGNYQADFFYLPAFLLMEFLLISTDHTLLVVKDRTETTKLPGIRKF